MEAIEEMVEGVLKVKGISRVVYDLTSKPPGIISVFCLLSIFNYLFA